MCEFCYYLCDSEDVKCVNDTNSAMTSLDAPEGGTYCYRITAFINGEAIALVEDSFIVAVMPRKFNLRSLL